MKNDELKKELRADFEERPFVRQQQDTSAEKNRDGSNRFLAGSLVVVRQKDGTGFSALWRNTMKTELGSLSPLEEGRSCLASKSKG